jgi:glycosyltransferase involved in cell wall biosynthesis
LTKATGDYVLFLDSDDLLVPFSLAPLLREAGKQKPDMVIAGFVKLNDDDIRKGFVPTETEATFSDTTGEEFFLGPFNPRECYVWHTLYRKDFLDANNLRFIEGIYFEDVPFTTECYLKAGRCLYTPQPIYIYRQHSGSICSTITMPKILDINRVLAFLWKLYCQTQDSRIKAQLMNTIFDNFCVETWFITHNKQLLAGRREFITDLLQRIPDLHFTGGLKARLISCLFRLMPNTYLWLRSL